MKRLVLLILTLIPCLLVAGNKVSLSDIQRLGWQYFVGQRITLTTPLVVCGTYRDSIVLAPQRLYVPEEQAVGLADGDSTDYFRRLSYNRSQRIRLECRIPYHLNLGSTLSNLSVRVMGERHLQTGAQPHFKVWQPSKKVPAAPSSDLTICAVNINNYFVHTGGYSTKNITSTQHQLQCYKTASALIKMNADLYALCELEQGSTAPAELVRQMNILCHRTRYEYVVTDTIDRDTISCGFIFDKERIIPRGELYYAYPDLQHIYAHRFLLQQFCDVQSGHRFYVSLNHLRSKRGNPSEANAKRMGQVNQVLSLLDSLLTPQDTVLLLGDYNAYGMEQPLQTIVRAGYQDMLSTDTLGYSYSYDAYCGYLDRVYASTTMAPSVLAIHPVHWNTDFYYSAAYRYKYNYSHNNPATLSKDGLPACRWSKDGRYLKGLSYVGKKNLLYRFSDHEPLLLFVKW